MHAARECIRSWTTDFTADLAQSPCRPWSSTATPTASCRSRSRASAPSEQVAGSELHVVEGGPHGINTSHAEEFNRELLAFLER